MPSPKEAAQEANVATRAVYDAISSGRLKTRRAGRRLEIDRASLDVWIKRLQTWRALRLEGK